MIALGLLLARVEEEKAAVEQHILNGQPNWEAYQKKLGERQAFVRILNMSREQEKKSEGDKSS